LRDFGVNTKRKTSSQLPVEFNDPDLVNNHYSTSQILNPPHRETLEFYRNNVKDGVLEEFHFTEVFPDEISKVLNSIHSSAVGADGISIKMIQLSCPFLLPFLAHIFNFCVTNGTYPACWKLSNIIPLPKKSNPSTVNDLRPISILSVLGKAFEKILASQLRLHLAEFDILPEVQSGFRAGFSCSTALTNILDDVLTATDAGQVSALVMLDFSKAFDTINHDILIAKFHYIGLGEVASLLLSNFLTDRSQRVVISGRFSDACGVASGVPQGSVLGPLLFSIYTSQLVDSVRHCRVHMYADDTQIYHSFHPSDLRQSVALINDDLDRLVSMSERHNLSINPLKSSLMLMGSRRIRDRINNNVAVVVNNSPIPIVTEAKNLGVWLDSDMRFHKHITMALQRAYSSLRMLYSNRKLLNLQLKKNLCESLVLSHLNYGDILYHSCLDSADKTRVQRLQNCCLRFIYGIRKRDRITHALEWAGWLSMTQRRVLHVACFYHRVLLTKTPPYLYNKIRYRTDVHNLNLRYKHTLTIPKHNLEIFKRSFSYCVASVCNALPFDFRPMSQSTFKYKLKQVLVRNEHTFY